MKSILAAFALLSTAFFVSDVQAAGMPAPVLYGWGDQIAPLRELPPDAKAGLKVLMKQDLSVGYYYKHFYLFHPSFDVWTWGGKFVLYDGNNYWPTTPAELEPMIGQEGVDRLSKPWFYWLPRAWIGLFCLTGVVSIIGYFSSRGKAERMLQQLRLREALGYYARCFQGDVEPSREEKQIAFAEGVEFLRDKHQMTATEADSQLRLLIREIERDRSQPFRYQASEQEQSGKWDEAFENYLQAAAIVEEWDPADHAFVRVCLERVRFKRDQANENRV